MKDYAGFTDLFIRIVRKHQFLNNFLINITVLQSDHLSSGQTKNCKTCRTKVRSDFSPRQPTRTIGS